eukprot:2609555-Prorocentrum_lima.AAC.1
MHPVWTRRSSTFCPRNACVDNIHVLIWGLHSALSGKGMYKVFDPCFLARNILWWGSGNPGAPSI